MVTCLCGKGDLLVVCFKAILCLYACSEVLALNALLSTFLLVLYLHYAVGSMVERKVNKVLPQLPFPAFRTEVIFNNASPDDAQRGEKSTMTLSS